MTKRPALPSARCAGPSPSSSLSEGAEPPRRRALRWLGGWAAGAALSSAGCTRSAERPWTGAVFPDFTLPDMTGVLHRKSDYAGHPLLVNFWATWCPPCRAEMQDLAGLGRALSPRGLRLLTVSVDDDPLLVAEYLLKEKLDCEVLLDAGHRWSNEALGVPGFPATYLIGSDGLIRAAWLGPRAWNDPAIQAEIAATAGLA